MKSNGSARAHFDTIGPFSHSLLSTFDQSKYSSDWDGNNARCLQLYRPKNGPDNGTSSYMNSNPYGEAGGGPTVLLGDYVYTIGNHFTPSKRITVSSGVWHA